MKIVFLGDSITDAGRDKRNYHDMGKGYPKFVAEHIANEFPNSKHELINLGISGNRTCQLFDRLYRDCIAFDPDIVSILIGINDILHRYEEKDRIETTDLQIETNYRAILERLKRQTNAKIVMLAPFLLDAEGTEIERELDAVLEIVRRLASEYADVYVPLDKYFREAMKTQPEPQYYSADGVHPNDIGRAFIGKHYFDAIVPLLRNEA